MSASMASMVQEENMVKSTVNGKSDEDRIMMTTSEERAARR